MKKATLTIGVASLVTITVGVIAAYFFVKNSVHEKRLVQVADEGYETAYDILFPLKSYKAKRY